jgi:hypothetical protein
MDPSIVHTSEHDAVSATANVRIGARDDGDDESLTLQQVPSQDQAQAQAETQVETLPQGRTALFDYDLRDWELATLHATRTRYGQHVVGWVFEQILENMTPGIVSSFGHHL